MDVGLGAGVGVGLGMLWALCEAQGNAVKAVRKLGNAATCDAATATPHMCAFTASRRPTRPPVCVGLCAVEQSGDVGLYGIP